MCWGGYVFSGPLHASCHLQLSPFPSHFLWQPSGPHSSSMRQTSNTSRRRLGEADSSSLGLPGFPFARAFCLTFEALPWNFRLFTQASHEGHGLFSRQPIRESRKSRKEQAQESLHSSLLALLAGRGAAATLLGHWASQAGLVMSSGMCRV